MKKMSESTLTDLSKNSIIELSGDNAKSFLQGQLTCDINDVSESVSSLAASCTHKGRVISVFRVLLHDNRYLLLLPNAFDKAILEHLQRFAPLSKVDVRQYQSFTQHLGIAGENVDRFFSENCQLPHETNQVSMTNECVIMKIPGPSPRYEILAPNEKSLEMIITLDELPFQEFNVWDALDCSISLPHISEDITAAYTPHMLDLKQHNAVSFTKGCYIGQEVIARTEHLGKAKRCLVTMVVNTTIRYNSGEDILNDEHQTVGKVINTARFEENLQALLIIIQKSALGSTLFLRETPLNEAN